ncbi:MAG: class A beta-lactamase-related serine hydrolase [Planctomycetia bacterium]|nr:class A beta-lactamase-related serine hydrolase [Planctomycetia bacterium]
MIATMNRIVTRFCGAWLTAFGMAAWSSVYATEPPAPTCAAVAKPWLEDGSIVGAVVLATDREQTLLHEALGLADLASARPMVADSLFWIASMTKPMTAAAVMMLVDEGKVALDEPVATYLSEFRDLRVAAAGGTDRAPARPITVRDLLAHTSGLPFMSPAETPTLDRLPLAEAVRSYATLKLLFEPGTAYTYSNSGINTAGRIIEVVSGMPFEAFMETRLFRPLGMRDTTFRPTAAQVARLATSYRHGEAGKPEPVPIGQLAYPLDGPGRFPMPGGGLFSTADDCGRFCRMLIGGGISGGVRILSADAVRQMRTRQTPKAVKEAYGLGVQIRPDGQYGHGGAFATDLLIDEGRGVALVWLVQDADPKKPSQACRDAVVAWLDGQPLNAR